MSAYVVDRKHIGYLVYAANDRAIMQREQFVWMHAGNRYQLTKDPEPANGQMSLCDAAQMLWDANVRSVQARYPEDPFNLPGPVDGFPYDFGKQFRLTWNHVNPLQVIASARCYVYQSCEDPGWEESNAKAFIDRLVCAAVSALPGYDEQVWGAPEPA